VLRPSNPELFVMRNVGNLVPPANRGRASRADLPEASAIEYVGPRAEGCAT